MRAAHFTRKMRSVQLAHNYRLSYIDRFFPPFSNGAIVFSLKFLFAVKNLSWKFGAIFLKEYLILQNKFFNLKVKVFSYKPPKFQVGEIKGS